MSAVVLVMAAAAAEQKVVEPEVVEPELPVAPQELQGS